MWRLALTVHSNSKQRQQDLLCGLAERKAGIKDIGMLCLSVDTALYTMS